MRWFFAMVVLASLVVSCDEDQSAQDVERDTYDPIQNRYTIYAETVRFLRAASEHRADSLGLEPQTGPITFLRLSDEPEVDPAFLSHFVHMYSQIRGIERMAAFSESILRPTDAETGEVGSLLSLRTPEVAEIDSIHVPIYSYLGPMIGSGGVVVFCWDGAAWKPFRFILQWYS